MFSLSFSQKSCSGPNVIRAAYRPLQQGIRSMSDHREPRSLKRSPAEWAGESSSLPRADKCPPHPGHRQKNVAGCCGTLLGPRPSLSRGGTYLASKGGAHSIQPLGENPLQSNLIPFLHGRAPGAVT